MPTKADKPQTTSPARRRPRRPLTRERVLREALRLVDDEGLQALTMRALGSRLEVEAMSLYNHVPGKEGLRDGIRELLWEELGRSLERGAGWKDSMREVASCLWGLARHHPHAFPLILGGDSLAEPMLRTLASGLATLEEAGFERDAAANTLNAVVQYALGYSMMELSYRSAVPVAVGGVGIDGESELDTIVRLTRALPPDAPPELVRVARDCCACDFDKQFEFGLAALLAGLDPGCNTRASH
jgi:TetR/AcrR family tetracycline transcriptional repressor